MPECDFQDRLSGYYDRELTADEAARFAAHLPGCTFCSEQLAGMEVISQLLKDDTRTTSEISPFGMARLHRVADEAARRNDNSDALPLGRMLMAIAASVLIVAGVWLAEIPRSGPAPATIVELRQSPEWERLARGNVNLPPTIANDTGLAVSEWMLDNLKADRKEGPGL